MGSIEFTDNYQDLSTDLGYQFKFHCRMCGNGHMSSYQTNTIGTAGSLMNAASSFLGGIFNDAANSAYHVQRAVGGKGHDQALREAVEEIRPKFAQCRRCGQYVCREVCFNNTAGMCKSCAPVAEHEETAIRAQHVQTQVANDLFLEENKRMSAKAKEVAGKCAKCGEDTMGAKFCPGCGSPVAGAGPRFCPECGAKGRPGAKFCAECGKSM